MNSFTAQFLSTSHLLLTAFSINLSAQAPSGPEPQKDHSAEAKTYIIQQRASLNLSENDLQDVIITDQYTSGGITHIYLRQKVDGIEIWNSNMNIAVANGNVVNMVGKFISEVQEKAMKATGISAEQAIALAASHIGLGITDPLVQTGAKKGGLQFNEAGISHSPIRAKQYYLQVSEQELRLVWNIIIEELSGLHWWNIRVDAQTGEVLEKNDWMVSCNFGPSSHCGEHSHAPLDPAAPVDPAPMAPAPANPNDYNVLAWPVESPIHGSRSIVNAPWNDALNASPYGWHDTDGSAGAEHTITRGNNVHAQEDRNANNGTGYSPNGGPTLEFDFPINFADEPIFYEDAAITNLFYWNNIIHDVFYQYGFDEVSGNFQENNYGNGGLGNDYVFADAQDGSGINNANFGTPDDGQNPRMQMFLWNSATPELDGDLDNGIIIHEYGHGISNRLVGGPSNTNCLSNAERMGEGWSDILGIIMTMEVGDMATDPRGVGTYALDQAPNGPGIRPAPYTVDFGVNSYTYGNIGGLAVPHGVGFVWCTMLWEMNWELVNYHGFDPDIYNGTGGNNIALQLIIEGMKLTPCNPGFVDARDAIFAADQALYGGANDSLLWAAFARRGLGYSADQGSSSSTTDGTAAFDLPPEPKDNDMAIIAAISPQEGSYLECFLSNFTVEARLSNEGLLDQTNIPVHYQLDNGPVINETYIGTINAGASVDHTFVPQLSLPGLGQHTLYIWSALVGDERTSNDTLAIILNVVNGSGNVDDDLESYFACSTNIDCGTTTCPLGNGWFQVQNEHGDDIDWRVDAGGTPSTGTGPTQDYLPGNSTGNYVYLESSGGCEGMVALLLSPCVDLTNSTAPFFNFAYHMLGDDMGELHLDLFDGTTWINDIMTPITGDQGSAWNTASIDLSSWIGQFVELRLRGITGSGFESDIALDALNLVNVVDHDISTEIIAPSGVLQECSVGPTSVEIELTNSGLFTESSIPIHYSLDGGTPVSEVFGGPININTTLPHTFSLPIFFPGSGTYELEVWSSLAGDGSPDNDTSFATIEILGAFSFPYSDDLESYTLCATTTNCGLTVCDLFGGWIQIENSGGDDVDWRVDEGGTVSLNTGPSVDAMPGTSTGNYLYLETSGGCDGQEAYLVSPCLDLSGSNTPTFEFAYHMYGAAMGSLHLDLFDGNNWVNDITPAVSGDQGDIWNQWVADLSAWAGQSIKLRIRGVTGTSYTSDMAIDAFQLYDALPNVHLNLKVYLEGPYEPGSASMHDDLRINGLIPIAEPFTDLGFAHVGGGGETLDPAVLNITGPNAIVDWVLVELRSFSNNSVVLATRSALLQVDGDVVSADGGMLSLEAPAGAYHIAIRHRNHLGCMTFNAYTVSDTPISLDFTNGSVTTWGAEAQKSESGVELLWAGNVNPDGQIMYVGTNNDRDPILTAIGGVVPTATISAYHSGDVNMDGTVKYVGINNDRDPILVNIGGVVPTNTRQEQLP